MIIVSDIKTTDGVATSEATGYPLSNALDYKKPWLKWRSTDTSKQIITVNFDGSVDCLTLIGANFENATIKSGGGFGTGPFGAFPFGTGGELEQSETLGYLRMLGEYRGFFTFTSQENSISIEIPANGISESYYTIGAIILGNKTVISHKPYSPLDKELALPVREVRLGSGIPKKTAMGSIYHNIQFRRRGMNTVQLNEFRDIKRAMGKTEPFIFYENLGEKGKVYLVRRIEDFSYSEKGYHDFQDDLLLEEIN